jgi:hypothetical protein
MLPASELHISTIGHRVSGPEKPNFGCGVERSLPRGLEKSRNAEVITTQTV